jgi:hypothetical protein
MTARLASYLGSLLLLHWVRFGGAAPRTSECSPEDATWQEASSQQTMKSKMLEDGTQRSASRGLAFGVVVIATTLTGTKRVPRRVRKPTLSPPQK